MKDKTVGVIDCIVYAEGSYQIGLVWDTGSTISIHSRYTDIASMQSFSDMGRGARFLALVQMGSCVWSRT